MGKDIKGRISGLLGKGWRFAKEHDFRYCGFIDMILEDGSLLTGTPGLFDSRWRVTGADSLGRSAQRDSSAVVFWRPAVAPELGGPLYPHPLHPLHVENLDAIDKLEAQGWEGPDASLSISLRDYDFAWRSIDPSAFPSCGDDLLIIHRHPYSPRLFCRESYKSRLDVRKEWDWFFSTGDGRESSFHGMLTTHGLSEQLFDAMPLQQKLYEMVNYKGALEIFGEPYSDGFQIREDSRHPFRKKGGSIYSHLLSAEFPVFSVESDADKVSDAELIEALRTEADRLEGLLDESGSAGQIPSPFTILESWEIDDDESI